jgi:hypothetical protein
MTLHPVADPETAADRKFAWVARSLLDERQGPFESGFRGGGRIAACRRVGDSERDLQIELDRIALGARCHSLEGCCTTRELRRRLRRRGARHRQLPGAQPLTRRRLGQPGFRSGAAPVPRFRARRAAVRSCFFFLYDGFHSAK